MRILLLTTCLFSILGAIAQDTARFYYPSGKLYSLQVRSKPDTNLVWERDFYESGRLRGEATAIRQQTKHSIVLSLIEYDDSGRLFVQVNDTASILYEADGSIRTVSPLMNHKKEGIERNYLDGKLFLTITYKEGKKDGWLINYNDDGSVFSKTMYKNDKQEGPTVSYDKKGRMNKTIDYVGGCPVKVVYFDAAGKPVNTLQDKKSIWLKEGKPIGCQ